MEPKEKEITNSKTGQRLLFVRSNNYEFSDTLHIRATYPAFSKEPPVHYHPRQTEYFKILDGEITFSIDGKIQKFGEGETVVIKPGQKHSIWNHNDREATLDWKVEPPLQTERFLRMMTAIANGPGVNELGIPGRLKSLYMLARFNDTIRLADAPQVIIRLVRIVLWPRFKFVKHFARDIIGDKHVVTPSPSFKVGINPKAAVICKREILISAPREKVWSLLTSINSWSQWQAAIADSKINSPLREGSGFVWTNEGTRIKSTLHTVNAYEAFGWTGNLMGVKAIHNWSLHELDGKTIVSCEESMSGFLATLLKISLRSKLETSITFWLKSLKDTCEEGDRDGFKMG